MSELLNPQTFLPLFSWVASEIKGNAITTASPLWISHPSLLYPQFFPSVVYTHNTGTFLAITTLAYRHNVSLWYLCILNTTTDLLNQQKMFVSNNLLMHLPGICTSKPHVYLQWMRWSRHFLSLISVYVWPAILKSFTLYCLLHNVLVKVFPKDWPVYFLFLSFTPVSKYLFSNKLIPIKYKLKMWPC